MRPKERPYFTQSNSIDSPNDASILGGYQYAHNVLKGGLTEEESRAT